jgi:hypothetical protein
MSECTLGSTEYDRNGPCRLLGDYMFHAGHPLVSGTKCRRLLFARFVTHSGKLLMQIAGLYETLAHSHRPKFSLFPENTGRYLSVTTIHIFINIGNIWSNTTQLLTLLRCISYIASFNDMFQP